jgi:hypothetical protein
MQDRGEVKHLGCMTIVVITLHHSRLSIDVTIEDHDKAFVLLNVSCVMLVEDDFGE